MSTEETEKRKERNSAIEMLRIAAMLMIILSHTTAHGDIKPWAMPYSANRFFASFADLGNLGVDIFVIIGGYLGCRHEPRPSRLLRLLTPVWFYSITIFLFCRIVLGRDYTVYELRGVLMPTIFHEYWFFTVYFILMLLTPMLNAYVRLAPEAVQRRLILSLLLIWSVIPTFIGEGMYSGDVPHFILMYLIGAYLRLCPRGMLSSVRSRRATLFVSLAALIALTIAVELIGAGRPGLTSGERLLGIFDLSSLNESFLFGRSSILIILIAASLCAAGIHAEPFADPIINTVGSCTYGIYLIHDNPALSTIIFTDIFRNARLTSSPLLPLYLLSTAAVVFLMSLAIELGRQQLFALPHRLRQARISRQGR